MTPPRTPASRKPAHLRWLPLVATTLLLAPLPAQDQVPEPPETPRAVPMLWRVEANTGDAKPSYLFGTMHSADTSNLADDPAVAAARESTDAVLTELDMTEMNPMEVMGMVMLGGGKSLDDMLPDETAAKLKKVIDGLKNPMMGQGLTRMKPSFVAATLSQLEYPDEAEGSVLDERLQREAADAGKVTKGLETAKEQVQAMTSLTIEEGIDMLDSACEKILEARKTGENPKTELVAAYRRGNTDRLWETVSVGFNNGRASDFKLMEALLFVRNRRMADRTIAWLEENEGKSAFVAVGAAHMPGDQGLVELMRKKGYRVTRIPDELARAEAAVEWAEYDLAMARYELARLKAKK